MKVNGTPKSRYVQSATAIATAAVQRGPIKKDRRNWRFGRRVFANQTIFWLIEQGIAVRDGNVVRLRQAQP